MIKESLAVSERYIIANVDTLYPWSFPTLQEEDIQVYISDGEQEELFNQFELVTYTNEGGLLRLKSLPDIKWKYLVIIQASQCVQDLSLTGQRALSLSETEKALDKLTLMAQRLFAVVGRCVKVPLSGKIKPTEVLSAIFIANQDSKVSADRAQESELMASASATSASASEASASESASQAKASETSVSASATMASTSADEARDSASQAKASETNAKTSETEASASASQAKESETNAKTSETNAKASASRAGTSSYEAKASETNAKTSETNAKASEMEASESASQAKASENSASSNAYIADAKASDAIISADKARVSESEASDSSDKARASEVHAKNSETMAGVSAGSAEDSRFHANLSKVAAAESADKAKASETESGANMLRASASATSASASEASASESATNAKNSEDTVEQSRLFVLGVSNEVSDLEYKARESAFYAKESETNAANSAKQLEINLEENHYTKTQTDSKIATIETELATKATVASLATKIDKILIKDFSKEPSINFDYTGSSLRLDITEHLNSGINVFTISNLQSDSNSHDTKFISAVKIPFIVRIRSGTDPEYMVYVNTNPHTYLKVGAWYQYSFDTNEFTEIPDGIETMYLEKKLIDIDRSIKVNKLKYEMVEITSFSLNIADYPLKNYFIISSSHSVSLETDADYGQRGIAFECSGTLPLFVGPINWGEYAGATGDIIDPNYSFGAYKNIINLSLMFDGTWVCTSIIRLKAPVAP